MQDIFDFFSKLTDTSDWPPRWHCGNWTQFNGWLYIISDLLIWAAYFAIPLIIIRYTVYKKSRHRFVKLYFLFAAFILSCGLTHLLDAIAFWQPAYRLSALTRGITAVISWITIFNLIKLMPYASNLKDPLTLQEEIEMRKAVEQQLEESRKTFKSAFDYSSIGIALISIEGKWLNVNQAICDMLGYTREELAGMSFQDITYETDLAADLDNVRLLLNKEKETYQMEKRYITKDRRVVSVLLSVSLVWHEDKPSFFISQLVDLTSKKILVKEVEEKNRKLEEANSSLQKYITQTSGFNRIIGHNLRGPASSLINLADYLEKNESEEDRDFLIPKIKTTSLSIIHTLNDLKDFLEIHLNQEKQSTPVLFEEALNNSLNMLDEQINVTGATIDYTFTVADVLIPKVYLDSIFYNLINNALKYKNPALPPVIRIHTRPDGDYTLLSVKDNGIGIDMEKYSKDVFQYKKIFHKGYDSNGVGLFLTKTQVESWNGKIEVDSGVNKGSEFRIFFKNQR